MEDVTLSFSPFSSDYITVALDLNGHVLNLNGYCFRVSRGGTLKLTDSDPQSTHKFRVESNGLWVLDETGDKTVSGGIIVGGCSDSTDKSGGGVYVRQNASFTMEGGSIVGCAADKSGGGVYIDQSAAFNMTGGSIVGCAANKSGGGVYIDQSATFNMTGGSITDCTADSGGGVLVRSGTAFTMGGGRIERCTAGSGGGVQLDNGTFAMANGSITDCSAVRGGGVLVSGGTTFTMAGGSITGCTAGRTGGGVQLGSFGAAMNADTSTVFTFHSGSMSGNTGGGSTNDVFVFCGTFKNPQDAIIASASAAPTAGDGTAASPYELPTVEQLEWFAWKVSRGSPDAYAKLTANIDLGGEKWTPIVNYIGTFDGNGKTISGLNVKDVVSAGLFRSLSGSAVVENLTVAGSVEASNTDGDSYAGGIAARMGGNAQIIDCVNNATVKATVNNDVDAVYTAYAGGMTGQAEGSTKITGCTNNGTVDGDSDKANAYTGGIAGYTKGGVVIENCLNTAALSVATDRAADADVLAFARAGGMVGCIDSGSTLNGCYNTGAVTATTTGEKPGQPHAGGMVGAVMAQIADATITGCGNAGAISATGKNNVFAGGIAGEAAVADRTLTVSHCYSTGSIAFNGDPNYGGTGGIVGRAVQSSGTFMISDCYWLEGDCGSYAGKILGDITLTGTERSKSDFADGTVLGLLKQNDTTNAWDVCGYVEAADMTLPLLKWQVLNARKYDIRVVDKDGEAVQITSLNQNDVLGDGTVSFVYDDANEKGILTLNGAELSSEYEFPIDASDMANLEIVLKGKNKLGTEGTCIIAKNLIFSGEGSLDITNLFFYAVDCTGTVTVNGGSIKIDSPDSALCFDGAFTVNGGTVELIGAASTAIVPNFTNLEIILADDRIMIAGRFYDGSDAQVTATSDADAISEAKYVRILNKYIPIVYDPGQYGTGNAATQNKTYGEDFGLADALFTRTGYQQTAWTTAENSGEILRLGSAYSGNEPLTLYPVWETEEYGITYDLGGGTVTGNPDSYTVESDSFTLNNPVKEGGYEFAGWSGTGLVENDNMTVTVPKGSTGSRSYKAHWRDIQAPVVNGLEDGKSYCSAVQFTATDNDGEPTVTVNGVVLNAQNGKYILAPKEGKQIVVISDNDGNSLTFNVTVNNGHTYEWQSNGNSTHTRRCTIGGCNASETDNCTGGTATCSKTAICEICGESYGELNTNNHADSKHFAAKSATENAEGNVEYWYCEGCDKYFADEGGNKEITKADTVTAKLPERKPTSPSTGDISDLTLWIALLFISGGAVTVTTVISKKKHSKE